MHVLRLFRGAEAKNRNSMSGFVSVSHQTEQFVKKLISLTARNNIWCFSILGRSYCDFSFSEHRKFWL